MVRIILIRKYGGSGAAFRQRFDACGWKMGASDNRYTIYREQLKPFELAFKRGASFRICQESDKSKAKEA
jgi:hypothetical protein